MVLVKVDDVARYGSAEINSTGRIIRFMEKGTVGPGLINSGVYFFQRRLWEKMAVKPRSLEKEILPGFLQKGVYGYPSTGSFIDIGTEDSYRQAGAFFKALYRMKIVSKSAAENL